MNSNLELMDVAVVLRPMEEDDKAFIFATWLRSFRQSVAVRNVSDTIYFKFHHKLIELAMSQGTTLCAVLEDSPSVVIGYINFGVDTINYAYVKNNFRRYGVGKLLVSATGNKKYYTSLTEYSRFITGDLTYNPYQL